jgi:hypothetical protein
VVSPTLSAALRAITVLVVWNCLSQNFAMTLATPAVFQM